MEIQNGDNPGNSDKPFIVKNEVEQPQLKKDDPIIIIQEKDDNEEKKGPPKVSSLLNDPSEDQEV